MIKPLKIRETHPLIERRDTDRKFKMYIKIKLPTVTSTELHDMELEVVNSFQTVVQRWTTHDKTVLVMPWHDYSLGCLLKKGSKLPADCQNMEKYGDRCYIAQGKNPWIHFCIHHHDSDADTLITANHNWYSDHGMWCKADELQVKTVGTAGWFLGSHGKNNHRDLGAVLCQHPLLKNIPITVRFQMI